jgi:biopolymer transport protein ExbD/biopolymer transport protein TolR
VAAPLGGGRARSGRQSALAEINVTPLVDVMLVLLIISMVASPMLQRGIHLELPATASATEIQEARFVVSVDREGRIRINDRPVHVELLQEHMKQLAETRPSETVFLRADKLLPYGEVLLVMDRIRTAGITRVSLVTVPLEITEGRKP